MKKIKEAHVSNTKLPYGDYYGTGIKNKTGRLRESYLTPDIPLKKIANPPRKLA